MVAPKRKYKKRSKVGKLTAVTKVDLSAVEAIVQRRIQEITKAAEYYWITQDGSRIRPSDMDEGHLRNTISYICRRLQQAIGSVRWVATLGPFAEALTHMLHEAKERGIQV